MGKIFWLVSVVLLAAAVALWGLGTLGVRAEADERDGEIEIKTSKIRKTHRAKKDIVNKRFIQAARAHKASLEEERESLKKVMRSRDLDVSTFDWGESPPPPREKLALFKDWLTSEYEKKNKLLKEADVVIPKEPGKRGEVVDWERELTLREIDRVLRELIVMREIHAALAAAQAKVTYTVTDEVARKEVTKSETRKVDELRSLEFGIRRRRSPVRGTPKGSDEQAPEKPYKAHVVTVTFVAHLGVVPDVTRRVERGKSVLFSVRSARLRRPKQRRSGSYGPPAAEEKYLRNTLSPPHEGPVLAEVAFNFYEFPAAREGAKAGAREGEK